MRENNPNEEADFTLVTRRKSKIIRGVAQAATSSIKCAERNSYSYVGNLHADTTEADLLNYLTSKFSSEHFVIEQLPKRKTAKSVSFKVCVKSILFASLMDENL